MSSGLCFDCDNGSRDSFGLGSVGNIAVREIRVRVRVII